MVASSAAVPGRGKQFGAFGSITAAILNDAEVLVGGSSNAARVGV
jgi:hypothetical protein